MRVLLIGGAGFIGRHLATHLYANGVETAIFDVQDPNWCAERDVFNTAQTSGIRFIRGDASDAASLSSAFRDVRPTLVYYLAAQAIVREAEKRPEDACRSMVHGLANGLNAARSQPGVERFIYVSSSMVYGDFCGGVAKEDHTAEPHSTYGRLKLAGENIVRALLAGSGVECVIIRPTGAYGPGERHARVVRAICEAALGQMPIRLVDPDVNFIDFTYISDVVSGLYLAGVAPSAAGHIFNLAYGKGRSLSELAQIVLRIAPGSPVITQQQDTCGSPRRGTLSSDKARREIGFCPQIGLERGVSLYLRHLQSRAVGLS